MSGTLIGTPAYMPPEQINGAQVETSADVFALGAILHELIAGTRPYTGKTLVEQFESTTLGRRRSLTTAGAPPELEALVARALAAIPAKRPADAAALGRDLEAVLALATPRRPLAHLLALGGLGGVLLCAGLAVALTPWGSATPAPAASPSPRASPLESRRPAQQQRDLTDRVEKLIATQRSELAVGACKAGVAELGSKVWVLALLARAELEAGHASEAAAICSSALQGDPENAPALAVRAELSFERIKPEAVFQDRYGFPPPEGRVLMEQADRDARRALKAEPRLAAAAALCDAVAVSRQIEAGTSLRPKDHLQFLARARWNHLMGHTEAAIRDADEAIRLAPERAGGWYVRGAARQVAKGKASSDAERAAALPDLERAVEIDPELLGAWELLVASRIDRAGVHDAEDHAVALGSEDVFCLSACVDGLLERCEATRALAVALHLARLGTERPEGSVQLARAELELGRFDDAILHAKRAFAIADAVTEKGQQVQALVVRAEAHAAKASTGKVDAVDALDALEVARLAVSMNKQDASARAALALALELASDPLEALDSCRKALDMNPSLWLALKVRGRVRLATGHPEGAEDLRRFLEARPRDRDADSLRQLLQDKRADERADKQQDKHE